jgi:hypothetical protein
LLLKLVPAVLDALSQHPKGLSGRKVESVLTAAGHGRNDARQALAKAVESGAVNVEPGPRNSVLHTLSAPVRRSAPLDSGAPLSECASAPIGRTAHTRSQPSAPPGALGLGQLPGRCPTCEHHVQTQGHAADCAEDTP